ncbi:T-complex protein 11-domain-containing protein [Aspergillus unguis]
MDLQKTKEAHARNKQEESTECPLEPYNGNGHSKESPKNDSLGRNQDTRNSKKSVKGGHRQKGDLFQTTHRPSPATTPRSSSTPSCDHSPSSEAINIPSALGLGPKETSLLIAASRYPPVTKHTLSELDLPCIMGNINLRMDANFDRDLHFKPDLDGEKGRKKRRDAADYWDAMAAEITIYAFCASCGVENKPEDSLREGSSFEPRLPALFGTLQDVLKTLVPERDHPTIMQNLEVPLLMQQIQKGVLDMVGIAKWLAALLKTHCAPMRDEWADSMVRQISSGSQSQNAKEIVRGLQTLFAILEAMKLDVANHQIRAFRVLLIEDTIPFLQEYFKTKIEREDIQVEPSRLWYQDIRERELRRLDNPQTDAFWPLSLLFKGLSEFLLDFRTPDGFPDTFDFDADRLWQLRAGLQNAINLEICWYIFESYIHSQRRYLPAPTQTYATFRSRIGTLMEESEDCMRGSPRWLRNVRDIALDIAQFASTECFGDATISDDVIGPIEASLEWHLSNEQCLFQYFQNTLREKLLEATFRTAKKYLNMSPLAICESQRLPTPTSAEQHYDIERISTRLAHIGVLHWKVWASMLYVRESVPPTDESIFQSDNDRTGLPCSGTKSLILSGLERGLQVYEEQHSGSLDQQQHGKKGLRILSIDMGIRNLAFAVLTVGNGSSGSSLGSRGLLPGEMQQMSAEKGTPRLDLKLDAWRRVSLPLDRGFSVEEFGRYLDSGSQIVGGDIDGDDARRLEDGAQTEAEAGDTDTVSPAQKKDKGKDKLPFSLPIYATHAHSIVTALLDRYEPTHVLIERQRFRSGGGAAVQEWSLRVGVFEGMLWAVLLSLQMQGRQQHGREHWKESRVIGIEPSRVGRFWAPSTTATTSSSGSTSESEYAPKTKKKGTSTSREGKKLKIDLVGSWLDNRLFAIDGSDSNSAGVQSWVDGYMAKWKKSTKTTASATSRAKSKSKEKTAIAEEGKRKVEGISIPEIGKLDDLADCLVQGVTWLEWEEMKGRLVREGVEGVVVGADVPA